MNGDMKDAEFEKFKNSMDEALKYYYFQKLVTQMRGFFYYQK